MPRPSCSVTPARPMIVSLLDQMAIVVDDLARGLRARNVQCTRQGACGASQAAQFPLAPEPKCGRADRISLQVKTSLQDRAARPRCKTSLNVSTMRHTCNWSAHIGRPRHKAPSKFLLGPQRQSSGQRKAAHGRSAFRSNRNGGSGAADLTLPCRSRQNSLGEPRIESGTRTMDTAFGPDAFARTAGIHFAARPACTSG